MPAKPSDDRQLLLQMIDEAYQMPNWNETSLHSTLRRVTPDMASWRPPHVKRSIADITVHCAYWKYALRRRLTGGKRGEFPLRGSNWFRTPRTLTPEQWSEYRALLNDQHQQLREAIQSTGKLLSYSRPSKDGQWTALQRTFWLAIHDGYHTGQINLIKAMYRRSKPKK